MPILVVKRPDKPPTTKSLDCVDLILKLHISINVKIKSRMLIANLKAFMLIEVKIKIPKGTPTILPKVNLFSRIKSMSILILQMSDIEIINDKIMFICIASCGKNNISKKGVAIMEKPKPVLVCKTEATNIIHMKINVVSKITPYLIKFNKYFFTMKIEFN